MWWVLGTKMSWGLKRARKRLMQRRYVGVLGTKKISEHLPWRRVRVWRLRIEDLADVDGYVGTRYVGTRDATARLFCVDTTIDLSEITYVDPPPGELKDLNLETMGGLLVVG